MIMFGQKPLRKEPPSQSVQKQMYDYIYVVSPMKLGFEIPGFHLDLITKGVAGAPMEAWEHIRLMDGKKSLLLQQLNNLRHHVHITDVQTALRYVRLITSPETWFLWKNGKLAVEILEAGAASALPNFGLKRQPLIILSPVKTKSIKGGFQSTYWIYDPRDRKMQLMYEAYKNGKDRNKVLKTTNSPDFSILGNGMMGILTHKAYQTGNYSSPTIKSVDGGFQITRWLFVEAYSGSKDKESIQLVQEFVGTDGEYRRSILKTISNPDYPRECSISIPKFE